jgi:hypothetical protein
MRKLLHLRDYVCVIFCAAQQMSGGGGVMWPMPPRKKRWIARFFYLAQRADKSEFLMIIIAAVCCCCNRVILPSDAALWPVVSPAGNFGSCRMGLVSLLRPFQVEGNNQMRRGDLCAFTFSIAQQHNLWVGNQGVALFFVGLN